MGGNGDFGDVTRETFDVVEAPTSAPTIPNMKDEDSNRAAIVGGVVGGVVLIVAIAALPCVYNFYANRGRGEEAATTK
jgi:hypothetical protein